MFVNGGGHDFVSNQILAPLGGGSNLGEPRAINFANIPSDQFFVISNGGGGTSCPADLNLDGEVDSADLGAVLAAWGTPEADLDGNGDTDSADLGVVLAGWGTCP